jgi:glycosyltransferase involved in cell wall biosynthesis
MFIVLATLARTIWLLCIRAHCDGEGCPVVSSNVPSLVEVGGDAVLYAGPDDGDRWVETIVGLSQNESLRATMSDNGRNRAGLFSWRRSAQVYFDEIERLLRS